MGVAVPVTFHEREQAFEAKFAHDEEIRFLAVARRDKLFARWLAEKLMLPEQATDALIRDVLAIPSGPGHDQALLRHVVRFMAARDAGISESELNTALGASLQQAVRQLMEMPSG